MDTVSHRVGKYDILIIIAKTIIVIMAMVIIIIIEAKHKVQTLDFAECQNTKKSKS
jgi:hypothetical protein